MNEKLFFSGVIKGVLYDKKIDEQKCNIIFGDDTSNYILNISFRALRDNITEHYNLSINKLHKDDFYKLECRNFYLPKSVEEMKIDLSIINKVGDIDYFCINNIIAINNNNVFFYQGELMNSNFLQVEKCLNLSLEDYKQYISDLYRENYPEIEIDINDDYIKNTFSLLTNLSITKTNINELSSQIDIR